MMATVGDALQPDRQIDDCLSVRHGHLYIEDCDTVELAARFGTPVYAVSENQLRHNARQLTEAFVSRWPGPVRLLPSIKANNVLALRHILTSEGLGCDTFGLAELRAALATGVPPEAISVNGGGKSAQLIDEAVAAGCRITLDSRRELELVIEAAERKGRRALVRARVRPDLRGLGEMATDFSPDGVSIAEASRRYKAGIPFEELVPLGRRALRADGVEFVGLHAHFSRHTRELDAWAEMMRSFGRLTGELSAYWDGWQPAEIDIGGGLATRRDPTGQAISRVAEQGGPVPSFDDYAETIVTALSQSLELHSMDAASITLEVEPGRACYADAGIHLSRVTNVKSEAEPERLCFVELDTTEMFLLDLHLEHNRWRVLPAGQMTRPTPLLADVVGISCGFDTIVADVELPELVPGEVVAFLDTGAYQEACSNNFNALPRPATVLVRGGEASVVRRAETVDDVFRRDVPASFSGSAGEAG
jgi:diaminopimelate decarboxylase